MLCVCHTTLTQKLFCLHVLRQAGPPQRVDCFWERALRVFLNDTATRYHIGSRTKVSQPFDCQPNAPLSHSAVLNKTELELQFF